MASVHIFTIHDISVHNNNISFIEQKQGNKRNLRVVEKRTLCN